jgi:predicted nucleic acid-binding protein
VIVVDASVAVKWFLPEDGAPQAIELLRGREALLAPDLIRIEVASAVTKRHLRGEISAADAKETIQLWIEALKQGVLQLSANLEDLREAANLSLQLNHHIADCLYLAVARRTSSRLITADKIFAEKAASVFPGVDRLAVTAAGN